MTERWSAPMNHKHSCFKERIWYGWICLIVLYLFFPEFRCKHKLYTSLLWKEQLFSSESNWFFKFLNWKSQVVFTRFSKGCDSWLRKLPWQCTPYGRANPWRTCQGIQRRHGSSRPTLSPWTGSLCCSWCNSEYCTTLHTSKAYHAH